MIIRRVKTAISAALKNVSTLRQAHWWANRWSLTGIHRQLGSSPPHAVIGVSR